MKENNDIKFDAFVQNRIKAEGLESPSSTFTQSVLSKIKEEHALLSVQNYNPLISKRMWYVILVVLIGVFGFLIFGDLGEDVVWLPQLTLQKISEFNIIGRLPTVNVSDTYVYAFVGLAIFLGVQVYLLKNHFEKRYFVN